MEKLVLHPDCPAGPIERVAAEVSATVNGCEARFRIYGDIGQLLIPEHKHAERMDNLWKTTCFEIFWQPDGGSYYREFNLSPSSRWACYDFDDFREGMRNAPVEAISVSCSHDEARLELHANIASALPVPANVALNGIVEDKAGNIQFWALKFAEGKAEFHSEVCRQWRLENRA